MKRFQIFCLSPSDRLVTGSAHRMPIIDVKAERGAIGPRAKVVSMKLLTALAATLTRKVVTLKDGRAPALVFGTSHDALALAGRSAIPYRGLVGVCSPVHATAGIGAKNSERRSGSGMGAYCAAPLADVFDIPATPSRIVRTDITRSPAWARTVSHAPVLRGRLSVFAWPYVHGLSAMFALRLTPAHKASTVARARTEPSRRSGGNLTGPHGKAGAALFARSIDSRHGINYTLSGSRFARLVEV